VLHSGRGSLLKNIGLPGSPALGKGEGQGIVLLLERLGQTRAAVGILATSCIREWILVSNVSNVMLTRLILVIVALTAAHSARRWIFHLGGLGFIPLGLLDSSVIPLPGSMDVLTIILSARKQELWLYYALMATIGSVMGGYVTYRLARKGGKETLERKFPARTLEKVYGIFERWGFGAIAIAALLPPPAPLVPFLFAAGAMQYSVGKFLVALTVGRIVRYSLLAFLAAHYGRQMLTRVMSQLGHPVLIAVIWLIAATIAALIFILVRKHNRRGQA
jgi:membrane protein YqaA with SNARE-associated domain